MGHYDPTLWCQLCTVVDIAILRFLDLLHLEHDFVIGRHCTVVCGDVGGCMWIEAKWQQYQFAARKVRCIASYSGVSPLCSTIHLIGDDPDQWRTGDSTQYCRGDI